MKPEKLDFDQRIMPGQVVLAAMLLEVMDNLYSLIIDVTPVGAARDLAILEWTAFRDQWKPRLERIINGKR